MASNNYDKFFVISDEFFMNLFWGAFFDFFLVKVKNLPEGHKLLTTDFILQNDLTYENIIMVCWLIMLFVWFVMYFCIYFVAHFFDLLYYLWVFRKENRGRLIKYWSLFLYIIYELPDWLVEYVAFTFRKLSFRNMEPHSIRTITESSVIHNRFLFVQLTFISFIIEDIIDFCKSSVLFLKIFGYFLRIIFEFFVVFYFFFKFFFLFFRFIFFTFGGFFLFICLESFHILYVFYRFFFNLIFYWYIYIGFFFYLCERIWNDFRLKNTSNLSFSQKFVLFCDIITSLQTDGIVENYVNIRISRLEYPALFMSLGHLIILFLLTLPNAVYIYCGWVLFGKTWYSLLGSCFVMFYLLVYTRF